MSLHPTIVRTMVKELIKEKWDCEIDFSKIKIFCITEEKAKSMTWYLPQYDGFQKMSTRSIIDIDLYRFNFPCDTIKRRQIGFYHDSTETILTVDKWTFDDITYGRKKGEQK